MRRRLFCSNIFMQKPCCKFQTRLSAISSVPFPKVSDVQLTIETVEINWNIIIAGCKMMKHFQKPKQEKSISVHSIESHAAHIKSLLMKSDQINGHSNTKWNRKRRARNSKATVSLLNKKLFFYEYWKKYVTMVDRTTAKWLKQTKMNVIRQCEWMDTLSGLIRIIISIGKTYTKAHIHIRTYLYLTMRAIFFFRWNLNHFEYHFSVNRT